MKYIKPAMYKYNLILFSVMFLLEGCCGFFTRCPEPPDRCAEEKIIAENIGKRIMAMKIKPELSLDDIKYIITPMRPHFVNDNMPCSEYFEQLRSTSQAVLRARTLDVKDNLIVICSQTIEPEVRDVSYIAAIGEQRVAAISSLKYINQPTNGCISK